MSAHQAAMSASSRMKAMNQVGARSIRPCFGASLSSRGKWQQQLMMMKKKKKLEWPPWQQLPAAKIESKPGNSSIRSDMAMAKQPSTYVSKISTNIPLYEAPGASFDQYLEDKPRVFKAIFPDKRRSDRLNEEVWRVQMLPIQFLFLTVFPVIDMRIRCITTAKNYPPLIPGDVSKVLELDIIRWELRGLDKVLEPSHFSLGVKGALYPDRRLVRNTRLKGQLEMSISFILPPVLGLVPGDVLQNVADSVLKRLVENMKQKVNGSLMADYNKFKQEQRKQLM